MSRSWSNPGTSHRLLVMSLLGFGQQSADSTRTILLAAPKTLPSFAKIGPTNFVLSAFDEDLVTICGVSCELAAHDQSSQSVCNHSGVLANSPRKWKSLILIVYI